MTGRLGPGDQGIWAPGWFQPWSSAASVSARSSMDPWVIGSATSCKCDAPASAMAWRWPAMSAGDPMNRADRHIVGMTHEPPGSTRQVHQHGCCGGDRIGRAPGLDYRLTDPVADGGEPVWGVAVVAPPDIPRIDMRQPDPQHARAGRTKQQRQAAWPYRSRIQHAILDPVVGAVEVNTPVFQQAADNRERFLEPRDPMIIREPERPVFPLVPTRAQAQDQPSARDGIDGRRLLGQHGGRMKTRRRDQRSQLNPLGDGRQRGKRVHTSHGPRLPPPGRS